jgi:hypothetical protein
MIRLQILLDPGARLGTFRCQVLAGNRPVNHRELDVAGAT